MEKETIEKLRELKNLVDEGILTPEEFDTEKAQLLTGETLAIAQMDNVEDNYPQTEYYQQPTRPRTIHIPWRYRHTVMGQSSPEGVIKKCESGITTAYVFLGIGAFWGITFIYYFFTAGFWSILGAFFGAFCPAIWFIIMGATWLTHYKDLKNMFLGMTQAEFEYVQDVIQEQRDNMVESVITFANAYQQQTGSNLYYDAGATIGNML